VTAESALAEARQAEVEIQQHHWRGALHGVPIALKDLVDTAGVRTTAGSELFKDRIPAQDAEVVRRLKAAGPYFSASSTCMSSLTAAALRLAFLVPFVIPGISVIVRADRLEGPRPLSRRTSVSARSAPTQAVLFANRRILRYRRTQANLRAREHGRSNSVVVVVGPSGSHDAHDGGRCFDAPSLGRLRPADNGSLDLSVPDYAAAMRSATSSLRVGFPRDFFSRGLIPIYKRPWRRLCLT